MYQIPLITGGCEFEVNELIKLGHSLGINTDNIKIQGNTSDNLNKIITQALVKKSFNLTNEVRERFLMTLPDKSRNMIDIKTDKMKRFLEFLGRNLDTYGENSYQLGWFGGENLVQYVRKFGKGLKGKNLMAGAMKMRMELKDREINQVETADEILRERERKDERADEHQNKRGRWADEMSDDEREVQNNWGREDFLPDFFSGSGEFFSGSGNVEPGSGKL